jgi:SPP1 family predicted phage head-tail adaptor
MALAAGRLRHRVALQSPTEVQDPVTGESSKVWVTIGYPFAAVEPVSVRAFIAAAAQQSEVRGQFVIRYRDGVDGTMRLLHRGKAYRILGTLADKESGIEYLTLPVSEGVNDSL